MVLIRLLFKGKLIRKYSTITKAHESINRVVKIKMPQIIPDDIPVHPYFMLTLQKSKKGMYMNTIAEFIDAIRDFEETPEFDFEDVCISQYTQDGQPINKFQVIILGIHFSSNKEQHKYIESFTRYMKRMYIHSPEKYDRLFRKSQKDTIIPIWNTKSYKSNVIVPLMNERIDETTMNHPIASCPYKKNEYLSYFPIID